MKSANLIAAFALATGSAVAGNTIEWLPAGEHDLLADRLTNQLDAIPASMHTETGAIAFAWPASDDRLNEAAPAVMAESRQYWYDTDSHSLAKGIELPISAPGAVIRLSALDSGSNLQLDPGHLELAVNGLTLETTSLEHMASGRQMRDQGLSVPEDSFAFKLPAHTDAGTLHIRMQQAGGRIPMVIHVHEPDSPWSARLTTPRQSLLAGQDMSLDIVLTDGQQELAVDRVQALLVSPDVSESWSLEYNNQGQLKGSAQLASATTAPGLYEAHVYAEHDEGGVTIRRDLKLAFGIAPASGRFTGDVRQDGAGFALNIGVEVAVDGRYQVNGEIYGTNEFGQLEPLAFAQSAATMGAGQGVIRLELDPASVSSSGLGAPFEVHKLQLLDQGRMFLLEERSQAIRVAELQPRESRRPFER